MVRSYPTSALPLGFRQLDVGFEAPRGEDRLRKLRHKAPRAVRSVEQAGELGALATKKSTETQVRKISGSGDADLRVRGDQVLLRCADIGTPLEQIRRQPGRNTGGRFCAVRLFPRATSPGFCPNSLIRSSVCSICCSIRESSAAPVSTSCSACRRSRRVDTPPFWRDLVSSSDSSRVRRVRVEISSS